MDGIPVTSVARTIFDLCGAIHIKRAARALDNALAMGSRPSIECRSFSLKRRLPVQLAVTVLAAAGIEAPTRQASVGGTTAPIGRVDLAYLWAKLVIEADSRRHHSSWLDVLSDRRRDALLTAAGWHVLRTNWHQLTTEPEIFVASVPGALARAATATPSAAVVYLTGT